MSQKLDSKLMADYLGRLRRDSREGQLLRLLKNEAVLWADDWHLLNDLEESEQAVLDRQHRRLASYQSTVRLLSELLGELEVPYSMIKAFRCHAYANTDVNVVVHPNNYPKVIREFLDRGWSIRSVFARTKEWLAERGKRKIVPDQPERFAEVHLYPCGTWHNLHYLSVEWVFKNSESHEQAGAQVQTTSEMADLLMTYGHCAFERYNLTLGELYHCQTLRCRLGEEGLAKTREVADENGWLSSFELVDRTIEDWWDSNEPPQPPVFLPKAELRNCWMTRSRYHLSHGHYRFALQEAVNHRLWISPAYHLYRRLKNLMRRTSSQKEKLGL